MRHGECDAAGRGQQGVTFVAVLVLLAVCMLGLGIAGPMWSQQSKRDQEQELLRIGTLYAQAIADYRDASPGGLKQYPLRLDELLFDSRYVGVWRHMRRLYADPVGRGQTWGLIKDLDGRILGVFSRSEETPIAEGAIQLGSVVLAPAKRYSDWKFMVRMKT